VRDTKRQQRRKIGSIPNAISCVWLN